MFRTLFHLNFCDSKQSHSKSNPNFFYQQNILSRYQYKQATAKILCYINRYVTNVSLKFMQYSMHLFN